MTARRFGELKGQQTAFQEGPKHGIKLKWLNSTPLFSGNLSDTDLQDYTD